MIVLPLDTRMGQPPVYLLQSGIDDDVKVSLVDGAP